MLVPDAGQTCYIKRLICEQLFAKSTLFQSLLDWQPFLTFKFVFTYNSSFLKEVKQISFLISQYSLQIIKMHSELEHYRMLIRTYFPEELKTVL